MKLSTKILTALLPAAALGTIVPATVSCSCGGNSYVINYGDDVNCIDEKAENYHSLDDVKNAVKARALKEDATPISQYTLDNIEIFDKSKSVFNLKNIQEFYYDLIASFVFPKDGEKAGINLSNWLADEEKMSLSFTLFGREFNSIDKISYEWNGQQEIWFAIHSNSGGKGSSTVHPSYRFSDCTYSG